MWEMATTDEPKIPIEPDAGSRGAPTLPGDSTKPPKYLARGTHAILDDHDDDREAELPGDSGGDPTKGPK